MLLDVIGFDHTESRITNADVSDVATPNVIEIEVTTDDVQRFALSVTEIGPAVTPDGTSEVMADYQHRGQ